MSKHVSVVPAFCESEVEYYFGVFEHLAAVMHWLDVWAFPLQCKLTGRAQDACSSLAVEGLIHDKLKSAILRPNLRKVPKQNYIDSASEKGMLFDRWCASLIIIGVHH